MNPLKKLITRKLAIAMCTIALFEIIGTLIFLFFDHQNKQYAELINIAGRQRMLSQNIGLYINTHSVISDKEVQESRAIRLVSAIDLFENSHFILNGRARTSEYEIDTEIIDYYKTSNLNQKVYEFISQSRALNETPASQQKLAEYTFNIQNELLKSLDLAVKQFERQAQYSLQNSRYVQIMLVGVNLLLLGFILAFLLLPLRNRIVELQEDTQQLINDLEEETSYRTKFFANMSHELRTPLNGILGVTNILKSKLRKSDNIDYLNIIEDSGKTLLGTIGDILDISKLDQNSVLVEHRVFNIHVLLEQTLKSASYLPSANLLNITFTNNGLPALIKSDEQKIQQIINNLLSNAIKFTEDGAITVVANCIDDKVVITVTDTGCGIEANKLGYIFEAFKQEDASVTRRHGGSGLGLSIARQFAKLMGGDLTVESTLNVGSSFTLTVPFKKVTEAEAELFHQENVSQEQDFSGNVLVVEDNEINILVISKILQNLRLNVSVARDGLEALECITDQSFELIFMDVHMPNLSGIETLQTLKNNNINHPPIVMLTADVLVETKQKTSELGVVDFIEKPFKKQRIIEVLNTHLKAAL